MLRKYNQFNSKRRIKKLTEGELRHCSELAEQVRYGGDPEHKRNPGDFGLTPPNGPRQRKSLCEAVGIFICYDKIPTLVDVCDITKPISPQALAEIQNK